MTVVDSWPGRPLQWVAAGVVLAATLTAVALTPRLPATVAIHRSAAGAPGNEVPRALAVALVPASLLGTWALVWVAARLDPPEDSRTIDAITCSTLVLLSVVHLLVLARSLDYRASMPVLFLAVAVWSIFVVGYTLHREAHD